MILSRQKSIFVTFTPSPIPPVWIPVSHLALHCGAGYRERLSLSSFRLEIKAAKVVVDISLIHEQVFYQRLNRNLVHTSIYLYILGGLRGSP